MIQHEEIIDLISSDDVNLSTQTLLEHLSDDVEYFVLANRPDLPIVRHFRGKEIVTEYLSILPQLYEIASRTVGRIVHDGPYLVAFGRDLAMIYPSKTLIVWDWILTLLVQAGKICRMQYVFHSMKDAPSASA